jgi:hypothetical protein
MKANIIRGSFALLGFLHKELRLGFEIFAKPYKKIAAP